ncbi:unnamed protein product [Paramecium octaurelia]|uniref:Uncharacterized protein n=1 Tax=Paramecium octaurelia TaxID=43137 RepID=A0A8S1V128_PAROT|nr:unnamed protein product [Paramecium octaurelia]
MPKGKTFNKIYNYLWQLLLSSPLYYANLRDDRCSNNLKIRINLYHPQYQGLSLDQVSQLKVKNYYNYKCSLIVSKIKNYLCFLRQGSQIKTKCIY